MWLIVVEWRTGVTTGCLAPDTMATLDFPFKLFMGKFFNSGLQIFVSFFHFCHFKYVVYEEPLSPDKWISTSYKI